MYKNPLNNGDISDYNSLKKQRNPSQIINKYKKKLATEPTELQKYYQYINKQKEDFNFIEDLKIKREAEMKQKSQLEKDMNNNIRSDLFDVSSTVKQDDPTPTINTDVEMTIENIPIPAKIEIQNDLFGNEFNDILSMAETVPEKKKKEKTPEELQVIEEKKLIAKEKKKAKKEKKGKMGSKEERTLNLL